MAYEHRFDYPAEGGICLSGCVRLEAAGAGELAYRVGVLEVEGAGRLSVCLTHSAATERFMYLGESEAGGALQRILDRRGLDTIVGRAGKVPGQLVLGAERSRLVRAGVRDCLRSAAFESVFSEYGDGEILVFPVLREGMKYGLGEAVLEVGGRLCDEIVVDAHHVADESVPGLGRRVELDAFKDADLSEAERAAVKVAIVGDSVASGTVIVGLVEELGRRFPALERIELVAPLAAVYGLARIAAFAGDGIALRIHCFETLLNALPPDYYFSPHFSAAEMHMRPEAYGAYRSWWGRDGDGRWIADTACAGYGWSEAFFNPGAQLRMIDAELRRRHGVSLLEAIGGPL